MVTSTYLPLTLAFFFPESTCAGYTHEVPISILAAVKVFRAHKDIPHSEIKIILGKDLRQYKFHDMLKVKNSRGTKKSIKCCMKAVTHFCCG